MRRVAFCFLISMLFGCDYFEKKKISSDEILKEELQTFNWNEVDVYPSFDSCNSYAEKEEKRVCFEETLTSHINEVLAQQIIVVKDSINDILHLTLEIDNSGHLSVQKTDMQPKTMEQIPELDSLLKHGFDSLPKIYPAVKRSQQVTTRFVLPIEIRIQ